MFVFKNLRSFGELEGRSQLHRVGIAKEHTNSWWKPQTLFWISRFYFVKWWEHCRVHFYLHFDLSDFYQENYLKSLTIIKNIILTTKSKNLTRKNLSTLLYEMFPLWQNVNYLINLDGIKKAVRVEVRLRLLVQIRIFSISWHFFVIMSPWTFWLQKFNVPCGCVVQTEYCHFIIFVKWKNLIHLSAAPEVWTTLQPWATQIVSRANFLKNHHVDPSGFFWKHHQASYSIMLWNCLKRLYQ